jgi:hypothetical protein
LDECGYNPRGDCRTALTITQTAGKRFDEMLQSLQIIVKRPEVFMSYLISAASYPINIDMSILTYVLLHI